MADLCRDRSTGDLPLKFRPWIMGYDVDAQLRDSTGWYVSSVESPEIRRIRDSNGLVPTSRGSRSGGGTVAGIASPPYWTHLAISQEGPLVRDLIRPG